MGEPSRELHSSPRTAPYPPRRSAPATYLEGRLSISVINSASTGFSLLDAGSGARPSSSMVTLPSRFIP